MALLDSRCKRDISEVVKEDMTEYEKELAIHDYIINNSRYDSENLLNNTLPPESLSAYGVLVRGTVYARAMRKPCSLSGQLGIECILLQERLTAEPCMEHNKNRRAATSAGSDLDDPSPRMAAMCFP
jgi:transglutaminase/protease-like cytokinesis protein 3